LAHLISTFLSNLLVKKMRKTLILMALIVCSISSLFAQKVSRSARDIPKNYLGLSIGVNNISGAIGATVEVPINDNYSSKIGLGLGSWGVKTAIAGKYYTEYCTSWSFGAGYSTASGTKGALLTLITSTGSESQTIKMDLERAHMIDLVAGKSWGKKVRFGVELGYSVKVAGGTFATQDKTIVLSTLSTRTMKFLSPDGLIFGLGLSFGL
jgi:hypothetical protein